MIVGIVIAAGASNRMRSPKALLKIGEKTFLQHIVGELRVAGITEIAIVLGAEARVIQKSLSWFEGTVVINEDWMQGQLSSINAGLCSVLPQNPRGALICPVDHPLITNQLISTLVNAVQVSGKSIIVPVHKGRRGHPVLFTSTLFDELQSVEVVVGARQVVRNHPDDIHEVITNEEGVVLNIDTPEEYQTHVVTRSSQDDFF